jgi:hypothetical protein
MDLFVRSSFIVAGNVMDNAGTTKIAYIRRTNKS